MNFLQFLNSKENSFFENYTRKYVIHFAAVNILDRFESIEWGVEECNEINSLQPHLKVSTSQKQLFLKLHFPKNERNIWQKSALASSNFSLFLHMGIRGSKPKIKNICRLWSASKKNRMDGRKTFLFILANYHEHGLRTHNEAFFHWNPELLGLCRQIVQINSVVFGGIFGQTFSTYFGTVSPLSMFSIIQPIFLQKTTPLYPHPKYLFGIGIWIWAAKN